MSSGSMKVTLHQTSPCPNCEELAGWIEVFVVRYHQVYDADGEPDEVSEFVQVQGMSSGQIKRCARCEFPITRLIKDNPVE